jgi:hypothetical protein
VLGPSIHPSVEKELECTSFSQYGRSHQTLASRAQKKATMQFTSFILFTLVSTVGASRLGLLRIAAPNEEAAIVHQTTASRTVLRSLFDEDADLYVRCAHSTKAFAYLDVGSHTARAAHYSAFRELFTVGGGCSLSLSMSFSMPQLSFSFSMPIRGEGDFEPIGPRSLSPEAFPISPDKDEQSIPLVEDGKGFMEFETSSSGVALAACVAILAAVFLAVVRKRQLSAKRKELQNGDAAMSEAVPVSGENA